MGKEAYYFCELFRTARSASAQRAFNYAARLGKYRKHPDPLTHLSSGSMPDWVQDRVGGRDYWTAADQFARGGARKVFVIVAALPVALDPDQRIQCAKEFAVAVSRMSDDPYGRLPYTLAIHAGYGRNPHLHLLISQCLYKGLSLTREQWFRRYCDDQPERGGARKVNVITQQRWHEALRETWEYVGNGFLGRCRTGYYLDRSPRAANGIDRVPALHLGPMWSPEHPHPGRQKREQRNREIAEETNRREEEDALLRRELRRLSRHALAVTDNEMRRLLILCRRANCEDRRAGQRVFPFSPLREIWQTGVRNGTGVVEPGAASVDALQWERLYKLVHEPAYRFAATHWLDNEWVAGVVGPFVVWLHPEAEALIDCGGAIWTNGCGPIEAGALALLLHSRGAQAAQIKGPQAWHDAVEQALQRVAIEVVTPGALATGAKRIFPKPSPYGAQGWAR